MVKIFNDPINGPGFSSASNNGQWPGRPSIININPLSGPTTGITADYAGFPTIGDNLQIQNIPPGSASNFVCGSTVSGNLQFDNNGTAVQIGSNAPLICPGNTIGGNLEANSNTNSALIFDNSVRGNAQVDNNTGPVDVVGNSVGGNLQCQGNSMLIMGGMNTAKQTQGQCN